MTVPLALVGEAWGESEQRLGEPFVGSSGVCLLEMLNDAGIITLDQEDYANIEAYWRSGNDGASREPMYIRLIWRRHPIPRFNVFNIKPEGNKIENLCGPKREDITGLPPLSQGKYFKAEHIHHVEKLYNDLAALRPNVVVAFGNTATWALLRRTAITRIRGAVAESNTVPRLKILPCIHPAAILRQWENRHVTVLDLQKAHRESGFPEIRRPVRYIWTEPSIADLREFYQRYIEHATIIAPDIETRGNDITCVGFATGRDISIVVPFWDPRRSGGNYWTTASDERLAWEWVRDVLNHPAPKVFQNGIYDLHFLWRAMGIKTRNAEHDSMLLHHALQPESPKGLGFLGSVYTDEASWKVTMRDRSAKVQTLKRDDT
jgi:uracil-DNA glycosylase